MEFLKHAKDFARNPLGIIALFVSLIYGFANLLLSSAVKELTEGQRWPLILFIVGFPFIVLATFYKLVTKHHGKLYAPGDFKDDQAFLRTLSPEKIDERKDNEVVETIKAEEIAEATQSRPATYEANTPQPKTTEYAPRQSFTEFKRELSIIEDAVIREISTELKVTHEKGVGLGETDINFDAFLGRNNEKFLFIEVKAIRRSMIGSSIFDRTLYNAVVGNKFFDGKFKLILAIVYFFPEDELPRFKEYISRRVSRCPAEIELRFIPRSSINEGKT